MACFNNLADSPILKFQRTSLFILLTLMNCLDYGYFIFCIKKKALEVLDLLTLQADGFQLDFDEVMVQ